MVIPAAHTAVNVIGFGIELVFIVFFARHLAFAIIAMRAAPGDVAKRPADREFVPPVSILVACKNEEAVIQTLIQSLLALDYPGDRLETIVIDDGSSDGTGQILDEAAAANPELHALHRPPGAGGGKSGALNAALDFATGDVIVVFDADHRPRPDCVRLLVQHLQDPTVSAVQGRCEIRNPDDSALARLISIDYKAGYLVNEYGRQSLFELPAYGGANCAVRASALRAVGGWNEASVTEDTDLTIRLILRGERVRYEVRAVDDEEAVATFRQFWRQRYRWARGHQQVWRDYHRAVWRSPHLSLVEKAETTMFLLVFHLPVISGVGLILSALWLAGVSHPVEPLTTYVLWTLLFLGPLAELSAGLLISQSDRRGALTLALFLPVFVLSILICSKAWFDRVRGRRYEWAKTKRIIRPPVAAMPDREGVPA